MSDSSFEDDVLGELGDDKLNEIASLLGTDAAGARDTVSQTVGAMTGGLQEKADADDDEVRQAFAEVSEAPSRAWPPSAAASAACSAAG